MDPAPCALVSQMQKVVEVTYYYLDPCLDWVQGKVEHLVSAGDGLEQCFVSFAKSNSFHL